jgi:hypothetical protein
MPVFVPNSEANIRLVWTHRTFQWATPASQVEHVAMGQRACGAIGHIVDGEPATPDAMNDLSKWRNREPLVHGAALISLKMTE